MTAHGDIAPSSPVVLVVDDDPAVRNSLKFSLQVEGFLVRAYASGSELLSDPDLPDYGCLVVDLKMPGMTGLDLVALLRERHVALPAILITTNPSAVVRRRAAEAGVPVIEKPLLGDALWRGIQDALARDGRPWCH
jgi:two-component system, LuxR family, response regulator FixJ